MSDLAGKVALVTGGGTGIGAAVVRRFADAGAAVGAMGRRESILAELAAETGALALPGDIRKPEDVERVVATLVTEYGGLDIVVNNAAVGSEPTDVETLPDYVWEEVLDVDLSGAMRIARAAIPELRKRGGGAIVNVSSIGGLFAGAQMVPYGTAKAALLGLSRSIARDFGRSGIRVNTLCPGWVDTPMIEPALEMLAQTRGITQDQARAVLCEHSPLERMARPDEIAACVEFLASDAASFVTGAVLVADGGQSIVDLGTLSLEMPRTIGTA